VKNIKEEIIELNFIGMKTNNLLTEVKLLIIYFQKTYRNVFSMNEKSRKKYKHMNLIQL
jgi:hypothetical protein